MLGESPFALSFTSLPSTNNSADKVNPIDQSDDTVHIHVPSTDDEVKLTSHECKVHVVSNTKLKSVDTTTTCTPPVTATLDNSTTCKNVVTTIAKECTDTDRDQHNVEIKVCKSVMSVNYIHMYGCAG